MTEEEAKELVCKLCACQGIDVHNGHVNTINEEFILESADVKYYIGFTTNHWHYCIAGFRVAAHEPTPWKCVIDKIVKDSSKGLAIAIQPVKSFDNGSIVLLSEDCHISSVDELKVKLDLEYND